ncbi:MAG: DUF3467 domain-containing protein [Myxococcota bacterium]
MADDETGKPKRVQIQVKLDEEVAEGSYVNMARIFHNQTEFVVDALFLPPQSKQATVRARLIMSPAHAKFLHAALTRNIELFEKKYGPIGSGSNDPGTILH